MPHSYRLVPCSESKHRQDMAPERIEFAVGEPSTVLRANCRPQDAAGTAVTELRRALAPALPGILAAD